MKLLVLGATGGTGGQFVTQALAAEHHVTVLVRDPSGIKAEHPNLRIIVGSLPGNPDSLAAATTGQDAVICALGRGRSFKSESLLQQSVPLILTMMQRHHVRRLILVSAIGVGTAIRDAPLFSRLFARTLLRDIYADKVICEELVRGSGIDWTIVQPVQLTDGPLTGKYQAGIHLKHRGMPKISRADVAHFILRVLEHNEYDRHIVRIGYT